MSWLRLDDGFAQHPKIARLPRSDRWTWLEVLLYCARYKTGGLVPASITEVVPKATPAFLKRCFELHLLDLEELSGGDYLIHDWEAYNPKDPTGAARMERYRQRHIDRNGAVTQTVTQPSRRP